MRSVNLISDTEVDLAIWKNIFSSWFPTVWLEHSQGLAQRENLPKGRPNKLGVEDGKEHVLILERPMSKQEYHEKEIEILDKMISNPRHFYAIEYTHDECLSRVLKVILQQIGMQRVIIDDEHGNLIYLEDFDKKC
jgi:hypothetical protein